jgi:hypothetical protein
LGVGRYVIPVGVERPVFSEVRDPPPRGRLDTVFPEWTKYSCVDDVARSSTVVAEVQVSP